MAFIMIPINSGEADVEDGNLDNNDGEDGIEEKKTRIPY